MPCQLCDRTCDQLTRHHLIPRQQTRRQQQAPSPTIAICAACHKHLHTLFDNRQLACELNTLEALRSHPRMAKFIAWVRKQDPNKRVRSFRAR